MTDRPPHVVSLQMKTDGLAPSARFDNSEDSELSEALSSPITPMTLRSLITPQNPPKTQNVKKSNPKTSACLFFLLTLHG